LHCNQLNSFVFELFYRGWYEEWLTRENVLFGDVSPLSFFTGFNYSNLIDVNSPDEVRAATEGCHEVLIPGLTKAKSSEWTFW